MHFAEHDSTVGSGQRTRSNEEGSRVSCISKRVLVHFKGPTRHKYCILHTIYIWSTCVRAFAFLLKESTVRTNLCISICICVCICSIVVCAFERVHRA